MIDAAKKILVFIRRRTRADLDRDEMLALAVVRSLEILGKAAKNVSPATKAKYSQIPWKAIARTTDRLSDAYFDVNLDIIWRIISRDLPPLITELEKICGEESNH